MRYEALGIAALALGTVLVTGGASAMPLAPAMHISAELERFDAAIDRVQYRNPRELSRDRYRRRIPHGFYRGHPYRYGFGANQHRDGVGVNRQPPSSNYTRRNFPYAYGDTYGYWPDQAR